jgi:hypothetical protein
VDLGQDDADSHHERAQDQARGRPSAAVLVGMAEQRLHHRQVHPCLNAGASL